MGTVLGNAMSGSEAIKLTTNQAMKIDADICNKLRCMMRGKAAWTDPETTGQLRIYVLGQVPGVFTLAVSQRDGFLGGRSTICELTSVQFILSHRRNTHRNSELENNPV